MAWLSTQLEELGAARLSAEEYAQLEARIRRLEHQEQAVQTLSQWLHQLSESAHAPPYASQRSRKKPKSLTPCGTGWPYPAS